MEDRSVHDKNEWDQAVKFFEQQSVKDKLQHTQTTISEIFGPSNTENWQKYSPTVSYDELTTIKKNMERGGGLKTETQKAEHKIGGIQKAE
jgi:optic atrophy protein 1